MFQTDVTLLELEWSESCGRFGSVGSPAVLGWLRAAYVPQIRLSEGSVFILAADRQSGKWTQHQGSISKGDAAYLERIVLDHRLVETVPRVESIPGSGDMWSACHVRVSVGERAGAFSVHSERRGVRGPDAAALRNLFARVYTLAGCSPDIALFWNAQQ